jgi:hypothetical protein
MVIVAILSAAALGSSAAAGAADAPFDVGLKGRFLSASSEFNGGRGGL